MVRLTVDMMLRCSSSHAKKQQDESRKHFLRRLTHLHLENRELDNIGDEFVACRNLIVLYLYDNTLTRVPLLDRNVNLSHLYLQNNKIDRIDGLDSLVRLTKLYLGGNNIVVLEGLEMLVQLQELHIENQHLSNGEKMLFDDRSLQAVAGSLAVLNVSGNGLTSLAGLCRLHQLLQLSAADNRLSDVDELCRLLASSWRRLERLDVASNRLCRCPKYRDYIILAAPALEVLDGSEVTETTRRFLVSWQANKEAIKQRLENRSAASLTDRHAAAGDGDGSLRESKLESYNEAPASFMMPALHAERFRKFLEQSRRQQSQSGHERADPRTALSGLFGYDSVYNRVPAHNNAGAGDGGAVQGQRVNHITLHNVNMDHVHHGGLPS